MVLVAHGLQKLFGWWGGSGLAGFKNSLSDVGYQHADILAYVSAGGEIVAGVLLVLGLFTPVAAAGALAFLINGLLASRLGRPHSRTFSFFLPEGHEYQITLIVIAVAVDPVPVPAATASTPAAAGRIGPSSGRSSALLAGIAGRCRRVGAAQRRAIRSA